MDYSTTSTVCWQITGPAFESPGGGVAKGDFGLNGLRARPAGRPAGMTSEGPARVAQVGALRGPPTGAQRPAQSANVRRHDWQREHAGRMTRGALYLAHGIYSLGQIRGPDPEEEEDDVTVTK